jgi:rifamycin polyketide synthase module 1/2/3
MPKAAVFDLRALVWNAATNARVLGLDGGDRALVLLDGAYCYALVHQVMSHLVAGGAVLLPTASMSLGLPLAEAARHRATTLAVVPAMLKPLLAATAHAPARPRLRQLTVGGAAAREELLVRAHEQLGCEVRVTYGLTEAGPRVSTRTFSPREAGLRGAVGQPMPGVTITADGEGELRVRSPSVRRGYLLGGALVPARAEVRTGDLGAVDGGEVRLLGRVRPVINRGGLKIAPGEIEAVLRSDERVRDARVVPREHPQLGEVPHAWVVPAEPPPPLDALARRCHALLGAPWVPSSIELVPSLPPLTRPWKEQDD